MTNAIRTRPFGRAMMLGTALAALGGVAVAAEPPANEVSGVVVTAPKLEETLPADLAKYGNTVGVVTSAQLTHGGFDDAGQALQMMAPGLTVTPFSGPFDYVNVSLQGSTTTQVLWLVDGIRINNRLYTTTAPLDTVPAHMIDRIEVLEGGQSLFYGTQAVAGAVNIVTKPFTENLAGKVSVGADTNKGWHADGYASDSFGAHRFVVYASEDQAVGFKPFRDSDYQPSTTDRRRSYYVFNAGAKYAYDFSDDLRFSAGYQRTDAKVDFLSPSGYNGAVGGPAGKFNNRVEQLVTAKVDWTPSDKVAVFLKGYWHDWQSQYSEFLNDASSPGTVVADSDHVPWGFTDYGLNALAKVVPTTGVETYLGYDLQKYSGFDDYLVIDQKDETVNAVFAQVRITPELLPGTHLAAGVRHNVPSEGPSATIWNASGQVDLSETVYVKASAGTSFLLPDAEQLFANDPIGSGEVGNPNLKPERSANVNASIGGRLPVEAAKLSWELTGFGRDVKDLIDYGPTADPDVDTFVNTSGAVKVRGAELALGLAASEDLSFTASGTYARAKLPGSGLQQERTPRWTGKAGVDYHPVDRMFGASATVVYVGPEYRTIGGFGRRQYGRFSVVDLGAYVDLDQARRHRLSARLENLFDTRYAAFVGKGYTDSAFTPYVYDYLGVPRTLHVKYGYSF